MGILTKMSEYLLWFFPETCSQHFSTMAGFYTGRIVIIYRHLNPGGLDFIQCRISSFPPYCAPPRFRVTVRLGLRISSRVRGERKEVRTSILYTTDITNGPSFAWVIRLDNPKGIFDKIFPLAATLYKYLRIFQRTID